MSFYLVAKSICGGHGLCKHERMRDAWVSDDQVGGGKIRKVKHCPDCRRFFYKRGNITKSFNAWGILAAQDGCGSLVKALASNCYTDPKSCGLRWITAHPNGESHDGVPLLVHDNGEEYTVVGGAGGSMNQTVFKKPADHDATASKQKAIRRAAIKRQKAAEMTEHEKEHLANKKSLEEEAKKQTSELRSRILDRLGVDMSDDSDVIKAVKEEAEKRAVKEKPDATPEEKDEFAKEAVKKAHDEAKSAAESVIRDALNHTAMRSLGEDAAAGNGSDFQGRVAGKNLVKHFSSKELQDFVDQAATIASLKGKAKAIARALSAGTEESIQGIEAQLTPLTPEQVKEYGIEKYLNGKEVDANTNLVKESEKAPIVNQRRNQANGAADGLNSFIASETGHAILTPDVARILGVENSARVAAEYLKSKGKGSDDIAKGLRQRIAQDSYAAVSAGLDRVGQMQDLIDQTQAAADADDGSVTKASASIIKAYMAQRKYQLLGVTRGQLRGAAALALHLEDHRQTSMTIQGGQTAISATARARGFGLGDGEFSVKKQDGGGYNIVVPSDKISKIAKEQRLEDTERSVSMDQLRQDVESMPGQWRPEGVNRDSRLLPKQELMARAIVQNKRMVINASPGTGKTPTQYWAAADLVSSGKVDRVLMTMPSKPRAQQNNYIEDGVEHTGEKHKFLSPEMADNVAVIKDGADLNRQLDAVKNGTKKIIIMSPQLMREKVEELKAAGFGGEKSAFFADEAHEFAIGRKDAQGSGMANAAKQFMKSEYVAALSGTLLENDASEFASLYEMVHPGSIGNVKQFSEEWKRLAQGQKDLFSNEAMRGMRDRLSGGMVSYHTDPKTKDEEGNEQALTLEKHIVQTELNDRQKRDIEKINRQYKRDRLSENNGTRVAAALVRDSRIDKILNTGEDNPKLEQIRRIQAEEIARDPKNRVGVYSNSLAVLAQAEKAIKGKTVRISGAEDDAQTRRNLGLLNDRTNDTAGVTISPAGNYGINATGMDHLIKNSPLDVASKEEQLDHRHFRHGQTRNVRTTTLVANHPRELMRQFRTQNVKKPEADLLAALSDDTGKADYLYRHRGLIDSAAEAAA